MEWDREKVCLLIDLYRSQRVLWDSTDPEFKNRNKKHCAWGIIATTLDLHRKEVESKMRKLVGQFYRECKKYSSSGTEEAHRKWYAYKLLLFLKDKNVPPHSQNNACAAAGQQDIEQNGTADSRLGEETEDSVDLPNGSAVTIVSPINDANPPPNRSQDAVYPTNRNKRKTMSQETEECYNTPPKRDEYDVFGEYVAHALRKLKTEHAKLMVKHEINTLLFNAGMGFYDERPRPSSPPLSITEEPIKLEGVDSAQCN